MGRERTRRREPMDAGITGGMVLLGTGGRSARADPRTQTPEPGAVVRRAAVLSGTVLLTLTLLVIWTPVGEMVGNDRSPDGPALNVRPGAEDPAHGRIVAKARPRRTGPTRRSARRVRSRSGSSPTGAVTAGTRTCLSWLAGPAARNLAHFR